MANIAVWNATRGRFERNDTSASTTDDVSIRNLTLLNSGDLTIGSIGLNDTSATLASNGAALIGMSGSDHLANAASATNVAEALDALDAAITAAEGNSFKESFDNSDTAGDLVLNLANAANNTTLQLKGAQDHTLTTAEKPWQIVDSNDVEMWSVEHTTTAGNMQVSLDGDVFRAASDGTDATLSSSGVLNVPSGASFGIGGTALSANWTAANIDELTALIIATDITGAQLETLSDGSNADSLHIHDAYLELDGTDVMTGNLQMGSNNITGMAAATAAGQAVEYAQWQASLAGLFWKDAVRVASDANIANLTTVAAADFDGTGQGITLVDGDRVLLRDQTNGEENGIYEYTLSTTTLARATDMDTAAETLSAAVFVQEGTYADVGYTQTADNVTLDTTPLVFVQFNGAANITDGYTVPPPWALV